MSTDYSRRAWRVRDDRRAALYREHLRHRYYADGGNAAPGIPGAGLTLYGAGRAFGARTWATYCDALRRADSIRDAYRAHPVVAFSPRTPYPVGGVA